MPAKVKGKRMKGEQTEEMECKVLECCAVQGLPGEIWASL